MGGQKRGGYARKHQAREDGDGQNVLLYFLAPLGLGRPKDDALDAVVDAATCLEGDRIGRTCEVVQIGLEEPKGLQAVGRLAPTYTDTLQKTWGERGERGNTHQQSPVDRLLAQVDDKLLQGHGLIVDTNKEVA